MIVSALLTAALPRAAAADEFAAGSLIVPMDIDYQDMGMLRAYGLVYELLRQGVPVRWVIKTGKKIGDADLTASANDLLSGGAIEQHGYRGGPWVIDAADVDAAMPFVEAWQMANPDVAVHVATGPFSGDVSRVLVVAPTIAMMADGNQKIARKYMQAAGIPDSTGDLTWPDGSPDMLDPEELSGPDLVNHRDGALFDADGDPVYCQFMSMHWAVMDAQKNPEVVAEIREFLSYPTHLFAECQAVNAFENLDPHGFFLTTKGFLIGQGPKVYDYYQQDTPFAQIDGPFISVGGSEPAYSLPPGEMYKASDVVMITQKDTPIGVNDVWMTGFIDGICPGLENDPDVSALCLTAGKVSYLGGHEYTVDLPISTNPDTQGARLFLNSLFEAPCSTAEGLPQVTVTKTAPAIAESAQVTFDLEFRNDGALPALDAVLTDTLPPGVTFVSATDDGVEVGGVVTWQLGNLGEGESGKVSVTVELGAPDVYVNQARVEFRAGVNLLFVESNQTMTAYGVEPTTDSGTAGSEGSGASVTEASASGSESNGGTGGTSGGTPTSGDVSGGTSGGGSGESSDSAGGSGGTGTAGGCGCRGAGDGGLAGLIVGLAALGRRRRA